MSKATFDELVGMIGPLRSRRYGLIALLTVQFHLMRNHLLLITVITFLKNFNFCFHVLIGTAPDFDKKSPLLKCLPLLCDSLQAMILRFLCHLTLELVGPQSARY
jgi:hypothetical protein